MLKRTVLFAVHQKLGGKLVEFGGWEMPVQYSGIMEEHLAVRQRVGLFDISHMGEVLVAGPNAERVLNRLLTNDVRHLVVGQAQYTLLGNDAPISALRGRFHLRHGVKVMPTFHPAYLLREPDRKRDAWSDLKVVMAELDRLGIAPPRGE